MENLHIDQEEIESLEIWDKNQVLDFMVLTEVFKFQKETLNTVRLILADIIIENKKKDGTFISLPK